MIFGAGIWGGEIVDTYKDIPFECFIDNKIKGCPVMYHDMPVISFQQYLDEYKEELMQMYKNIRKPGRKL